MTVLCDFTVIQEGEVRIGDTEFVTSFLTTKRHNTHALLMMNVFGLTRSSAEIRINGKKLKPLEPGKHNQWFSQRIVVPPNVLTGFGSGELVEAGNSLEKNRLQVKPALDADDDFIVRDIVIFFHQHDD